MEKLVFAHRGASRLEHENTLKAFSAALAVKSDGIELDVRKTADGKMVVIHDPKIAGKRINRLTLEKVNGLAGKEGFAVPELADALALISGKAKVQIELKEQGYEADVVKIALAAIPLADFAIISFNFKSLQRIKQEFSEVSTGLIIGTRYGRFVQMTWFYLNRKKFLASANLISVHWKLWQSGFAKLLPAGFPFCVWTADEDELIKKLIQDPYVLYIVSNLPEKVVKLKQSYEQK